MPHVDKVPMRSVVYVIIEDRENHEIYSSNSILIDAVQLSTRVLVYTVELLNKCGIHQAHQYVTVHDKDIFRTDDQCEAVREDRHTRLQDANKTSEHFNKRIKNLLNTIKIKDEQFDTMGNKIAIMKLYYEKYKDFFIQAQIVKKTQASMENQNVSTARRNKERIEYKDDLEKKRQQDETEDEEESDETMSRNGQIQFSKRVQKKSSAQLAEMQSLEETGKRLEQQKIMREKSEHDTAEENEKNQKQNKIMDEESEKQETINNAHFTRPLVDESDTSRPRSADEDIDTSTTDSDKSTGSAHSTRPASPEHGNEQSGDDAVRTQSQSTEPSSAKSQQAGSLTKKEQDDRTREEARIRKKKSKERKRNISNASAGTGITACQTHNVYIV